MAVSAEANASLPTGMSIVVGVAAIAGRPLIRVPGAILRPFLVSVGVRPRICSFNAVGIDVTGDAGGISPAHVMAARAAFDIAPRLNGVIAAAGSSADQRESRDRM